MARFGCDPATSNPCGRPPVGVRASDRGRRGRARGGRRRVGRRRPRPAPRQGVSGRRSRDPGAHPDARRRRSARRASLGRRIEKPSRWRKSLLSLPERGQTTGYRLVHAEGDQLAGLVVDVYGEVAAVQLLTVGMKRREADIFAEVARVTGAQERSSRWRARGCRSSRASRRARRSCAGPTSTALHFQGARARVCDRARRSRRRPGSTSISATTARRVERLAHGRRVLDAFSYVGGFALAAARGGATSVVAIDSSAPAIATERADRAHERARRRIECSKADVKRALPEMAQRGETFDMVIVDPPKLAPTARHLEQGRKAYRRLNAAAIRLLNAGRIARELLVLGGDASSGELSAHDRPRGAGRAGERHPPLHRPAGAPTTPCQRRSPRVATSSARHRRCGSIR